MRLVGVPPEHLEALWPDVSQFLESASQRDDRRLPPEEMYLRIRDGKELLFVIDDGTETKAALVVEFIQYAEFKTLNIVAFAGHGRNEWMYLLKLLEDWARDEGCRFVEFWGRPGWGRVLKEYRETARFFQKEL